MKTVSQAAMAFACLTMGLVASPNTLAGRDCSIFRDALQRSACEKEDTQRYMREQQSIRDQHQSYYQRGSSSDGQDEMSEIDKRWEEIKRRNSHQETDAERAAKREFKNSLQALQQRVDQAAAREAAGRADECIQVLGNIYDYPYGQTETAAAWGQQGRCLQSLGRVDAAISAYQQGIKEHVGIVVQRPIEQRLWTLFVLEGRFKEANDVGKAIGYDNKLSYLNHTAVHLIDEEKRYAEAVQLLGVGLGQEKYTEGRKELFETMRGNLEVAKAMQSLVERGKAKPVATVTPVSPAATPAKPAAPVVPTQPSKPAPPPDGRSSDPNWLAKSQEYGRLLEAMFEARRSKPAWELEDASKAALVYRDYQGNASLKAAALMHLGIALQALHSPNEAKAKYEEALTLPEKEGGTPYQRALIRLQLGRLHQSQQQYPEAEAALKQALKDSEGQSALITAEIAYELADLYRSALKRPELAEPFYKQALAYWDDGSNPAQLKLVLSGMQQNYDAQQKYAESAPILERLVKLAEKREPSSESDLVYALRTLANNYERQSKFADRGSVLERLLALQEKRQPLNESELARSLMDLADNHVRLKRYAEAEPLYQRVLTLREKSPKPDPFYVRSSLGRLVNLYAAWNKPEEKARYMARYQAIQ